MEEHGSHDPHKRRAYPIWISFILGSLVVGAAISYSVTEWVIDDTSSSRASGPPSTAKFRPGFSFEDAQNFDKFTIYWLGDSIEGLPLESMMKIESPGVRGHEDVTGSDIISLTYGTCQIEWGQTGCPVPLSIHINPYCVTPPEALHNSLKVLPPEEMRGAVVQYTSGRKTDVLMWTNDAAISIHGTDPTIVVAAIKNLVALTPDGPKSASEELGPPVETTCPDLPYATGRPVEEYRESPGVTESAVSMCVQPLDRVSAGSFVASEASQLATTAKDVIEGELESIRQTNGFWQRLDYGAVPDVKIGCPSLPVPVIKPVELRENALFHNALETQVEEPSPYWVHVFVVPDGTVGEILIDWTGRVAPQEWVCTGHSCDTVTWGIYIESDELELHNEILRDALEDGIQ